MSLSRLPLLLLLAARPSEALWDCSTYKSCSDCYNASSFCHWCAAAPPPPQNSKWPLRLDEVNLASQNASQDLHSLLQNSTAIVSGRNAEKNPPGASRLQTLLEKASGNRPAKTNSLKGDEVNGTCHTLGAGCVLGASCDPDGKTNSTCIA